MVTNLSSFSSHLDIIHIHDGDYEGSIATLRLNLNLKRLGCSGRSALTAKVPSAAHKEKFCQVFKTADVVPLDFAVCELALLVQTALFLLGYLPRKFLDGLLCDSTMDAIQALVQDFSLDREEVSLPLLIIF